MRVTYLGHACLLIEVAGKNIVTDPWLTEGAFFGSWYHTHLLEEAGIDPHSLPKQIDCLFLSHEHQDHFDVATLKHLSPDTPIFICKFDTPKFRHEIEELGFRNIRELDSGVPFALDDVTITIFDTAEYTNDAAIVVEGDGAKVFNETDCKLSFEDYQKVGTMGIDLGFYMFAGANWFPMMYDYPDEQMEKLIVKRRRTLMRSFIKRVEHTKPRFAVPSSGPCMLLHPEMIALNSDERGIFLDPAAAASQLQLSNLESQAVFMAASDVWDSDSGFDLCAPPSFRQPRWEYIQQAAAKKADETRKRHQTEPPAGNDFGEKLESFFNEIVRGISPEMRQRIDTKLALDVTGPQGGQWTVAINGANGDIVQPRLHDDWSYKIEVEDRLLYPFVSKSVPFFEDLLITFRAKLSRRPLEVYSEPLYHFLYEPNQQKLEDWYARH